ncbi:MAG: hypothetical protein HYY48_06480 [Gammaproteobacteria bacterium]|nr:hypothetical protein [Gammaproteobacteria bacterium]
MKTNGSMVGSLAAHLVPLLLLVLPVTVSAARVTRDELPEALRDWTGWVLYQEEEKTCPFLYSQFEAHRCAWPTGLELSLAEQGGRFAQQWQVHVESWIALPGDDRQWPQDVTLNDAPASVSLHEGQPAIRLGPGRHQVRGAFAWTKLPESLPIPRDTGIIQLDVAGKDVEIPDVDEGGNLWLSRRGGVEAQPAEVGDRLKLQVFRRVVDEIPLQLVTRIDLEASGTQREELLTGALAEAFIPLRLDSRIPARLEPDGRLRVQVRPGRWTIEVVARFPGQTTSLELKKSPDPWPAEEVWVFDARNELRLVEVEGPASVDPRQTSLPGQWQNLPAYLMEPGSAMTFKVIRRGDPEPEPDNLSLQRNLWLDFEGGGYTLQDNISGTMTRGWRLDANPPMQLGRASLDGEPQFITTLAGSGKQGVEVRRGQLQLSADSRYEQGISKIPAVGWDQDFQSVGATLHLPPGWDLISASGIDNVPDTWVKRWTLLDIFLVLIAALAVRGLWQWKFGLLALVALVLIWHEPGAPRIVWLHVLGAIALLRVLPEGRFQTLAKFYRNLSLLALVVISVPFMVDQVRTGLYPQLEHGITPVFLADQTATVGMKAPEAPPPLPQAEMPAEVEALAMMKDEARESIESGVRTGKRALARAMRADKAAGERRRPLEQVDPDANVQTGPGLPNWQWKQIALNWIGPVQKDQQIALWLMSPGMNLICNLLRVLLIAALALIVLDLRYTPRRGLHRHAAASLAAVVVLSGLLCMPADVRADIPDQKLLDELKTRLLAPPECLPECAQSPRLRLELTPFVLAVRMEIHALEAVAVPLPARSGLWIPQQVSVDGSPAQGLMRTEDGTLWVNLPRGAHQVLLSGPPSRASSFQLPLPLVPRYIGFNAEGWSVEGVVDHLAVGGQLQFTRLAQGAKDESAGNLLPQELPPFVRVERTLQIGLDWTVHTRVLRASPPGTAVVIEVPLLPGESVTTDGVKVKDGKVLVNMPAMVGVSFWDSSLEKSGKIDLTAPDTTDWTEVWRADTSPIWHMAVSGIAVVHHQDNEGRWLPEWRPWPGEGVGLEITRPAGVEGQTLTVDQTEIRTAPGKRATDTTMTLTLRSSRGGQHTLTLPENAELQSVTLNGAAQPIRQEGRSVTLPLVPGTQSAVLTFRSPQGIATLFRTPALDIATPSVNTRIHVALSEDRWTLLLGGPRLGPAVLFWGVLLVVVLIAVGLGRTELTPLRTWHWVLLGIGLTQTSIWEAVVIVGWLLALGARAQLPSDLGRIRFNFMQFMLAVLTLLALGVLFGAVKQGLLGLPAMQSRSAVTIRTRIN